MCGIVQLLKRTQDTSEQLARVRKQGEDLAQAGISESAPDNSRQQERLAARVQVGISMYSCAIKLEPESKVSASLLSDDSFVFYMNVV